MELLQNLFLMVMNMSITTGYIILFIIAVRFFLRKMPAAFSYALWSLVWFRMVCPVSLTAKISLLGLIGVKSSAATAAVQYVPADIGHAAVPQIDTGIGAVNTQINGWLPAAMPLASVNPMQVIIQVMSVIWLTGILLLLLSAIVSYVSLRRRLRSAQILSDNIYQCDGFSSPFVFGLIKPKIYIPFGLDEPTRALVLQHEQKHIRRLDYLVKPLAYLAAIIHWFNPIVWLAFKLMIKDMESSCDESIIRSMGTAAKADYSRILLAFSTSRQQFSMSVLALGENNTKTRIKKILSFKKPAFWALAATVLICAAVLAIGLANPENKGGSGFTNLVVVNESSVEIGTIGVGSDKSSLFAQNADNSLLAPGEQLGFDLGTLQNYQFTLELFHGMGKTIGEAFASQSFVWNFDDTASGKLTLRIIDNGNSVLIIPLEPLAENEMKVIVYTGEYSTNSLAVRNSVVIRDPVKTASIQSHLEKIFAECPVQNPSATSTLALSRMIDISANDETMTLFSQGHDFFYLYKQTENKYYYLGEYYQENHYAPFRAVVFDSAGIADD